MSLPRITPRPPGVLRVEEDPNYFLRSGRYGAPRITRRHYEDGTVSLFFGDYRVHSIRRSDKWSMPNNPYTILDLDDGGEIHLGRISSVEDHWLNESLSPQGGLPQ